MDSRSTSQGSEEGMTRADAVHLALKVLKVGVHSHYFFTPENARVKEVLEVASGQPRVCRKILSKWGFSEGQLEDMRSWQKAWFVGLIPNYRRDELEKHVAALSSPTVSAVATPVRPAPSPPVPSQPPAWFEPFRQQQQALQQQLQQQMHALNQMAGWFQGHPQPLSKNLRLML